MTDPIAIWERLCAPESAPLRKRARDADPSDVSAVARLRKKHDAELVRAALQLADAQRKLDRKWPADEDEPQLIADPEGAEMASGFLAARHKAERFARARPGARVLELCCGIGADAVMLARAGMDVVAVDHDPLRAWMAARNAACAVRTADVEAIDLDAEIGEGMFHLDPSRRDEQGRRISYELLSPGPDFIARVCEGRTGAVKLPPGIDRVRTPNPASPESADGPPEGEIEYISERGRMTQAVLWTGALAESAVSATALREGAEPVRIAGEPGMDHQCPWAEVESCAWVHTADPCVERAGLLPALCARTGLGLAHPGTGLLCGDACSDDAFLSAFRLEAVMPWRREKVRDWLRAHDGGIVEIKTRGKAADTDKEQRALRGPGATHYTVFVLRFGQAVRAMICRRP